MQTPARPDVLVIGNSHTDAIAAAARRHSPEQVTVINLARYFDPVNRHNKDLPPRIVDLFQPRRIYCSFGGSEHNVFGLLESPVPFDFMMPGFTALEPGREVVACGMIHGTLKRAMRTAARLTQELKALYALPISHICTPPPFRDLGERATLPTVFQANLHLGITPASIRRKLHALHSAIARDMCDAVGIGFLDTPPAASDRDGFLRAEYCSKDPTHANEAYGELVLAQIARGSQDA